MVAAVDVSDNWNHSHDHRSNQSFLAARFRLGLVDLELPDRGGGARRRPRPEHLGHALPDQGQGRQRRHRRRRLRPLSPLQGRRGADEVARAPGLPVFGGLAAGAAARAGRRQRARPRFLRPADRRGAGGGHRALALPLSLGPAAGARRPRRLDQPGQRGLVRRLQCARLPALRRPGQEMGDLQRVRRLHDVRLRHRLGRAGRRRQSGASQGDPSRQYGAWRFGRP